MNGFAEVCFNIFIGCLTAAVMAFVVLFVITAVKTVIRSNDDKNEEN